MLELRGRIAQWVYDVIGPTPFKSKWERTMRCLEEANELAQAEGISSEDAHRMVNRVFNRPKGDPVKEGAALGVTWLAWTYTRDLDPYLIVGEEVERIEKLDPEKVREKHIIKAYAGLALFPDFPEKK